MHKLYELLVLKQCRIVEKLTYISDKEVYVQRYCRIVEYLLENILKNELCYSSASEELYKDTCIFIRSIFMDTTFQETVQIIKNIKLSLIESILEEDCREFDLEDLSSLNKVFLNLENTITSYFGDFSCEIKEKEIEEERNFKAIEYEYGLYDMLFSNYKFPIVFYNQNGTIYKYSKEFSKLVGMERLEGKKIYDILKINANLKTVLAMEDVAALDEDEALVAERHFKKFNGKEDIYIETFTNSIEYKGEKLIFRVFRDISKRKKVERLKEKLREENLKVIQNKNNNKFKMEFFSNVSHELRTPLNVILSVSQLLYKYKDKDLKLSDERVEKYLEMNRQNSLRLLRMVGNLIEITKIDSGYINLNLSYLNIVEVVEEIVSSAAKYISDKKRILIFDTNVEEKFMYFDRNKVEKIVLNLLSNAIKFTKENSNINIVLKDLDGVVEISVSDNGIGIAEENQEFIFDSFTQVNRSFNRTTEGSGIGLSLVKSFAELHGGDVYVKSSLDKGSIFIVTIPTNVNINKLGGRNSVYVEELNENTEEFKRKEMIKMEFSDIYD